MKRFGIVFSVLLIAAGLLTNTSGVYASQSTSTFESCKQLWKKFPNGVAVRGSSDYPAAFADYAVRDGFLRPQVLSTKAFNAIRPAKRLRTQGATWPRWFYCGRPIPKVAPPTPANLSAEPSVASSVVLTFQEPAGVNPAPVYDIFVDGVLHSTYETRLPPRDGVITFRPVIFGLASSTQYAIYVVARNSVGSSAPTPTVTVVTSAAPKNTYTLEYSAGCASGNCSVLLRNASGGTDRIDPTGSRTWTFEISKRAYEIYSIMVFDNTYSSETSCQIKLDGRVVESASSTGGASAYCGYITK